MKKFLSVVGLLASLSVPSLAYAEPMSCGLTYDVKGGGFQIGLGYFKLSGTGQIRCLDRHGEQTETRDVRVTIGGHPIAARVGIGYFHMKGASGSFGYNDSLDEVYGHYLSVDATAAVGIGAGAQFTVQNPRTGLRMSIGIEGSVGLGIEAGFSTFTIEPVQADLADSTVQCDSQI